MKNLVNALINAQLIRSNDTFNVERPITVQSSLFVWCVLEADVVVEVILVGRSPRPTSPTSGRSDPELLIND